MNVVLWGAGDGGLNVINMLPLGTKILGFIDIDTSKWGKKLLGIPIYSPEEHDKHYLSLSNTNLDYLIISNVYGDEIKEYLSIHNFDPMKILDFYNMGITDTRRGTLKYISHEIQENCIPGEVAEVGVYKGDFAKYINLFFPQKQLYLFDTFSGFSQEDILLEKQGKFSQAKEGDYYNDNINLVLNKMSDPECCKVFKGYFPNTVKNLDEKFCFVSLDTDLYKPIYEGLKYFYPRLSKGGYIMIHDYNGVRFQGVKKAVKQFSQEIGGLTVVPVLDLDGSAIVVKQ